MKSLFERDLDKPLDVLFGAHHSREFTGWPILVLGKPGGLFIGGAAKRDLDLNLIDLIPADSRYERGTSGGAGQEMKTWDQDSSHVISFNSSPVSRIDKAFRAAVQRANLTDVTPHTLKHTAVTWAFMKGMTLEDATAYFATSRETLESVYRSHSPDAPKTAVSIMDWKL